MTRHSPMNITPRGLVTVLGLMCLAALIRCAGTGGALPVIGPIATGNSPPTLTITMPDMSFSISQGDRFVIAWEDADIDDNALIAFSLLNTVSGFEIPLVSNIQENDRTNMFSVSTNLIPEGTYNIRGVIDDSHNPPVTSFATTPAPANQRVVLTVTPPGMAPPNVPPQVVVLQPAFGQSVSQDEQINVVIQPTTAPVVAPGPNMMPPGSPPYDPDSDVIAYFLLDVDTDPNNDDPANDQPGIGDGIVLLGMQTIPQGDNAQRPFNRGVDLSVIPTRPDGSPYFVRVTLDDRANPRRHAYAAGTIQVVEAAQGVVDVATVGNTRSGVRFQGFNPGSMLGYKMTTVRDFDGDGIDDMVLVARFGNPGNVGSVGEAYLIYGLDHRRFGGTIDVNSTSTTISGTILAAPPVRPGFLRGVSNPHTDGITDASVISDLNGDGRPELLLGMPHVDGVFNGLTFDPGDDPPPATGFTVPVRLVVRQGGATITVGMGQPTDRTYTDAEDTYIDATQANLNFGVTELRFAGPPQKRWTLIKFKNLLGLIPDPPARITNLAATITFNVFDPGDAGDLHEAFSDFHENSTTYNNYANAPGDPQANVDYNMAALGNVAGAFGPTMVTITPLIQKLVAGQLAQPIEGEANEVRMIVTPGMMGDDVQMRSSEFNQVPAQRPTLIITYDRVLPGGGLGCYPDLLSNNLATAVPPGEPLTIPADSVYEAQGFATIIHSNNRDNSGVINPLRLADTVVWLELVGQQPIVLPPASAFITQLAGVMGGTHIEGARFQSGWYDNVDASQLNQPPMNDLFGWNVASIGDITNDQLDEIIVSAPRNERDLQDTIMSFGAAATHVVSRGFTGSIVILAGHNYDVPLWQDTDGDNAQVPILQLGSCQQPLARNVTGTPATPADSFQIFAENVDDFLALGQTAGDFQLDGVPDILCTAKFNGYSGLTHSGAAYVIYERSPIGDVHLNLADNPASRPPMLRIRGEKDGDQIGFSASTGQDVNGDRIPDVFISSPAADFGPVPRPNCAAGVDLNMANFQACRDSFGSEVFDDDPCKQYDFNNDRMIDDDDLAVLNCLMGPNPSMCCPVDNGFVGVVFGGRFVDGDRTISQIGTTDLPGIKFYGAHALDRAGYSVSSAGDFNRDGFGDLLISVPGEKRMDTNLRTRVGTAYLIFGGTHLTQGTYSLAQVGTADLPGIVFISPFVENRPNEAPIDSVGLLGDINNDGFDDIGLGITRADFIDQAFPQDPNVPGTNPNIGRRPDDGNIYIVYGNNIGTNRAR